MFSRNVWYIRNYRNSIGNGKLGFSWSTSIEPKAIRVCGFVCAEILSLEVIYEKYDKVGYRVRVVCGDESHFLYRVSGCDCSTVSENFRGKYCYCNLTFVHYFFPVSVNYLTLKFRSIRLLSISVFRIKQFL